MANHRTPREALEDGVELKDWFVLPGGNQPARRHEVWTLLGWYHEKVVRPNQGLRGLLRRGWWRLTGQWDRLESPWETIHRKVALGRAARARREELALEFARDQAPQEQQTDRKIEVVRS